MRPPAKARTPPNSAGGKRGNSALPLGAGDSDAADNAKRLHLAMASPEGQAMLGFAGLAGIAGTVGGSAAGMVSAANMMASASSTPGMGVMGVGTPGLGQMSIMSAGGGGVVPSSQGLATPTMGPAFSGIASSQAAAPPGMWGAQAAAAAFATAAAAGAAV